MVRPPAVVNMTGQQSSDKDLARKPLPFLYLWGLPIVILLSVNFVQNWWPVTIVFWMMIGAYAWMGVGCVINAARCGRLHCYFTGPIFLLGALGIFLVGFDMTSIGGLKVHQISYITVALALLSFVLEWNLGKYRPM